MCWQVGPLVFHQSANGCGVLVIPTFALWSVLGCDGCSYRIGWPGSIDFGKEHNDYFLGLSCIVVNVTCITVICYVLSIINECMLPFSWHHLK